MMGGTEDAAADPKKEDASSDMLYKVEDVPPWYLCIILGLQHYVTMMGGAIAIPFIISSELCLPDDSHYRGQIISAVFFSSGIATFLQATFGNRLPILQGPSAVFIVPVFAILSDPKWDCPSPEIMKNMTDLEVGDVWMSRMREVQGAIVLGAIFEVIVGLTGLTGLLLQWITPLAIVPTITLIGLALFKEAARQASGNWWIAALTILLLIVFSQFLAHITVPRPAYSKEKGFSVKRFHFFQLFSVLLTIITAWGFCAILTATNAFSSKNQARTDLKLSALWDSDAFRVPYPGQYGRPSFSFGAFLGIAAGVVASIVESIGDYYACAKLSGAPPPPTHALNRGIMMEGIGSIFSALCGTGSALTSFSQNIGAIAITKVGSRRVIQYASVVLTFLGVIGKVGALFIIIPSPIMGGIFCIMFAIITGVGLTSLQYINLNSSRNLFILGFSIFMGLCVPTYLQENTDAIQTGSDLLDQMLGVLLKTNMFVGGFIGCFLDNLVPGSEEERGLTRWKKETMPESAGMENASSCYNLPCGMNLIKKWKTLKYIPISPTFRQENININLNCISEKCSKRKDKLDSTQEKCESKL